MQWCWLCNKRFYASHYLIPNTKCYGAQFPVNGQFEWEDHDPNIFEEARLHVNDPEPQVPISLNVRVMGEIRRQDQRHINYYDYFRYLSPSLNKNNQVEDWKTFILNLLKDLIIFIIVGLFNCFGNVFFLILLLGNSNFMRQRIFERRNRHILVFKINYFMTMVLLWCVYFISFVGFIPIAIGVYFTNSIAANIYRFAW